MTESFERAFYENPDYWAPDRFVDVDEERARLAVEWLPSDAMSILDVGCGNGVLVNRLYQVKRVVGFDRSLAALRWVHAPRCMADAAFPPFRDNTFDAVAAMEVIEHLPFPFFQQTLAELVRLARRYILVTVPYCEDRGGLQVTCPLCGCRFHPYWHVRSFERVDMERLFNKWDKVTLVRLSGIVPMQAYGLSWLRKLMRRPLGRKPPFPWYAVCPQCGYSRGETEAAVAAIKKEDMRQAFRRWLRRAWPKESSYIWWMALYACK